MHSRHCWDALFSPLFLHPSAYAIWVVYIASWSDHPQILTLSQSCLSHRIPCLSLCRTALAKTTIGSEFQLREGAVAAAISRLPGTVLLWLGSCLPGFVSLILFDVLPLNFSAASECQVLFFFLCGLLRSLLDRLFLQFGTLDIGSSFVPSHCLEPHNSNGWGPLEPLHTVVQFVHCTKTPEEGSKYGLKSSSCSPRWVPDTVLWTAARRYPLLFSLHDKYVSTSLSLYAHIITWDYQLRLGWCVLLSSQCLYDNEDFERAWKHFMRNS